MSQNKSFKRYKQEKDISIIEVAVKNSRQLFNERDPAPFRERDLDPQFVLYLVSSVEEFPLAAGIKIRILTADPEDLRPENSSAICEAIRTYFQYESALARSKLRKNRRTARYFFLIGLVTLIICMSLAQYLESLKRATAIAQIASVSLVIIGWVAMWHPIEALLYDWWPLKEQQSYFDKISNMDVEVKAANI